MKLKFFKPSGKKQKISTYACNRVISELHFIAIDNDETGLPLTDNIAMEQMRQAIRKCLKSYTNA